MALKESTVVIDTETGLPTLPEEYFWKVETLDSGTGLYLQLMKVGTSWKETKPRGFFRKAEREIVDDPERIDYSYVWLSASDVDEDVVVNDEYVQSKLIESASKLISQLQKEWDLRDLLGKYAGNYPPKTLNKL